MHCVTRAPNCRPFRGCLKTLAFTYGDHRSGRGNRATSPAPARTSSARCCHAPGRARPGPADPFPGAAGPAVGRPRRCHRLRAGSRAITRPASMRTSSFSWPLAAGPLRAVPLSRSNADPCQGHTRQALPLHVLHRPLVQRSGQVRAGADEHVDPGTPADDGQRDGDAAPLARPQRGPPSGRSSSGPRSIQSFVSARPAVTACETPDDCAYDMCPPTEADPVATPSPAYESASPSDSRPRRRAASDPT